MIVVTFFSIKMQGLAKAIFYEITVMLASKNQQVNTHGARLNMLISRGKAINRVNDFF